MRVSDVPTVVSNGSAYREFLLDINQKSSASRLSLDEVRIFIADQPNLTGYDSGSKTLAGRTASFDLDSGADVSVMLDARLNSGSGSGDMFLLVPASAFAGAGTSSFVYLFSKFGDQIGATANGGFEEWAVRPSPVTPTPAGTASLSGAVFLDPNFDGMPGIDEVKLVGVPIQLIGVNDLGQTVSLTTVTGADGTYSFTGLRAGTYTIIEGALPPEYSRLTDGPDVIGTVGGVVNGSNAVNDQFSGIQLRDGDIGINYNFVEVFNE